VKRWTLALLASGTAVGALFVPSTAYAYPPGTHMDVSASPLGPGQYRYRDYLVTVTNAKPGCTVQMQSGNQKRRATVKADGTASAPLRLNTSGSRATVIARTVQCQGARETTATQISIQPGRAHGPSRGHRGRLYNVRAEQWLPQRTIVLIAVHGRHQVRQQVRTDRNGAANLRFTPDQSGRWAIVLIQDGRVSQFVLDVD
jgi:hypothetical protein